MKMRGLNHVNLVVSDVDRAAEFYQGLFGMERQSEHDAFVFLACGETDLALVAGRPLIHRRFHLGFRVDSRQEVDAWLERVRAHGAPITHGPAEYEHYYTFSCRDPDGYALEIYYEPGPRGRAGDVTA
ncbi:MAG: VOC family protein [Deltaproteobacteria bacterium]|jgi:catechol 2,3-dioxygenase-like lactoylglutathione lyase family enzyme|nr:VOC family protein [Deltaproteobacteria bacterium]MBW2532407.1 VOC family protein [Deltaproteobacteria bacterium]